MSKFENVTKRMNKGILEDDRNIISVFMNKERGEFSAGKLSVNANLIAFTCKLGEKDIFIFFKDDYEQKIVVSNCDEQKLALIYDRSESELAMFLDENEFLFSNIRKDIVCSEPFKFIAFIMCQGHSEIIGYDPEIASPFYNIGAVHLKNRNEIFKTYLSLLNGLNRSAYQKLSTLINLE